MDKRDRPPFSELESQLLATEIVNLRSAIEKMTVNDTAMTSQTDQLKYQIAALSEATMELERRLNSLERHRGWVIVLGLQIVTVIVIVSLWWWWGVWN
jgi:hypothetical protein